MYEHKDPSREFDMYDYFANPSDYVSKFEQYIPHLSMIINCVYWDERYPRLLTKEYLKTLFSKQLPRLKVVGDISCDVEGAMECTIHPTTIEDPVFVYNPFTEEFTKGFDGEGLLDNGG